MVAREALQVGTCYYVPVVVLKGYVIHQSVGVLCQAFLTNGVVFIIFVFGQTKLFSQRGLVLQLLIVALAVGVVQGQVMAPLCRRCPCCRENVVVLIEVVGGVLPLATVAQRVALCLIVASSPSSGVVYHVFNQCVYASQSGFPQVFVRVNVGEQAIGVIVAGHHTVPCLARFLKVANVFIANLEVVAQPSKATIVRACAAIGSIYIALCSALVVGAIKDKVLAQQAC